jgi:ADP-ribosylglycohydrolase
MQFPHPDTRILPASIRCVPAPINNKTKEQEKIVGSLVGLAIGDALGASVEFRPHQYLVDHPIKDMQGGGTWGLQAGQWTDDTSMALCLASSLITRHGFDPYDQMVRYKWWYKKGFLSSTGECFDIGSTTRTALEEFSQRQNTLKQHFRVVKEEEIDRIPFDQVKNVPNFNVVCGKSGDAGNGPLMRLAPVPLFYFRDPERAVRLAGESARLTHGDQKAIDACRYYAALIVAAVCGESKDGLLNERFYEQHQQWFGRDKLHDEVLRVAGGSYKKQGGYGDGIRGKNYIVNTLEAALWAFWSDGNSFAQGALNAVNLGDDTDTTAAVYGQLAGAYYGVSKIPPQWATRLYARDFIICVAEWLYVEGSSIQSNTSQQQQHTSQHQTQSKMGTTQSTPHQTPYTSTQIKASAANKDIIGYGAQKQQAPTVSNPNVYHAHGLNQKKKVDPSARPPAGLPSGYPTK